MFVSFPARGFDTSSVCYLFILNNWRQVPELAGQLHCYIEPAVFSTNDFTYPSPTVTSLQLSQLMSQLDSNDIMPQLMSAALDFVHGPHQTMLLLGDAGAGKSTFCRTLKRCLAGAGIREMLDVPFAHSIAISALPWIPLTVDLKVYTASEIMGLLPRLLTEQLRLPFEAVEALRLQEPSRFLVRLLLICDGYDELVLDAPIRNLTATLCGGSDLCWPQHILKVVVTSRPTLCDQVEEATIFGPRHQLLLLPFTKARVRLRVADRRR